MRITLLSIIIYFILADMKYYILGITSYYHISRINRYYIISYYIDMIIRYSIISNYVVLHCQVELGILLKDITSIGIMTYSYIIKYNS